MSQLFANNAKSTLASAIASTDTTLTLASGQGALFPALSGADYFLATLVGLTAGAETSWEVVKVTARSADALTVTRAQESTTAGAWVSGTAIELRWTAGAAQLATNLVASTTFTSQFFGGF